MVRLQAADPLEALKNHPEAARSLSELIDAFAGFIWTSPSFGSHELFQREKLDQDERAWRPRNDDDTHTVRIEEEGC
jgi:hypothetical protein